MNRTTRTITKYKYILLKSNSYFKRVYPNSSTEIKSLINADRVGMCTSIDDEKLVFIYDSDGNCKGLNLNEVATQLCGYDLYGDLLIRDDAHRFAEIP
jgi:hypothetical protein